MIRNREYINIITFILLLSSILLFLAFLLIIIRLENKEKSKFDKNILPFISDLFKYHLGASLDSKSAQIKLLSQNYHLPPNGIVNVGNSCFFNALVQCLLSLPEFVNLFKTTKFKNEQIYCLAFQKFIQRYENTVGVVDPRDFIKEIKKKDNILSRTLNRDMQESYTVYLGLIDELSNEFNINTKDNILKSLFQIKTTRKRTCSSCNHLHQYLDFNNNIFLNIITNIPDSMDLYDEKVNNVLDSPWKCINCNTLNFYEKNIIIPSKMKYLVIINTKITEFNIKDRPNIKIDQEIVVGNSRFELVSIVIHTCNHYYSLCKRKEWIKFNDASATSKNLPLETNSGCIFFYKRVS